MMTDTPRKTAPAARDPESERHWLENAELLAGPSGFVEHVTRRLALGGSAYGNRWTELGLRRLLVELSEEAADLGAWGVLALQALEREPAADNDAIARMVQRAILAGARAHVALTHALQFVSAGEGA